MIVTSLGGTTDNHGHKVKDLISIRRIVTIYYVIYLLRPKSLNESYTKINKLFIDVLSY